MGSKWVLHVTTTPFSVCPTNIFALHILPMSYSLA